MPRVDNGRALSVQPRASALADDLPLEFRNGAEYRKNQASAGVGRVNILGNGLKPHLPLAQAFDRLEQLPGRSRQAVEFPRHQGVAGAHEFERGV